MLTDELLAKLPEAQRSEWTAYIAQSRTAAANEHRILDAERTKAEAKPAPGNRAEFEYDSDTPTEWFASAENQKLAEIVISYQTPTGGWSKAVDYTKGPRQPGTHWTSQTGDAWHYCGTFDNRATTEQIKFLAGVFTATKREDVKAALMKGLDYVFAAQYPNGGWPQNYPVERGYHEAITLNDDAMIHILEVLHDLMLLLRLVLLAERLSLVDPLEYLEDQQGVRGHDGSAGFADDIWDRHLGGFADLLDVVHHVARVLLDGVVHRALEVGPGAIVVDAQAATDVEVAHGEAHLDQLAVEAGSFGHRVLDRDDVRDL
jgi:hypothetical protein